MKQKYKGCLLTYTISVVNIIRETTSQIVLENGYRKSKVSLYEVYRDSFEDVKKAIIDDINYKISTHLRSIAFKENAIKQLRQSIERINSQQEHGE